MSTPSDPPTSATNDVSADVTRGSQSGDDQQMGSDNLPFLPPVATEASAVTAAKKPSIWDALHIPTDVQDSAKAINDIVGAISTAVSWVGTVQTALRLAGFIKPEPNPFDTLYQRIQADLRLLLTATLAGATENRLRAVAEQTAFARTAAQTANEYLLLGRPQDEFHVGQLILADHDSLVALNVLSSDEWWLRSHDPSPPAIVGPAIPGPTSLEAYDYWWHPAEGDLPASGTFDPPAPSGGLIWDYRHILPAYLQAVAARIVVLKARAASSAEFLQLAGSEIPGYVAFLTQQHTRIKESILVTTPPPPTATGNYFPPFMFRTGAVELYSGTHVFGFWNPLYFDVDHLTSDYDVSIERYNAFVADCWRRVYNAVGLVELDRVIDNLNSLLFPPCDKAMGTNASASAALLGCVESESSYHLFTTGGDGALHVFSKPEQDAVWQLRHAGAPPGTRLERYHHATAVAFGQNAGRRIYAFVRDDNGRLYTHYWDGASWRWADQGSPEASVARNPSATTFEESGVRHIRAYAVGTGKLQCNWWDGTGWQWLDLGKAPQIAEVGSYGLESAPTVIRYQFGGAMLDDVYVSAPGGIYEHVWYENGGRAWSKPTQPNDVTLESMCAPTAVSYEQGGRAIVHVFAVDIHGHLHSLEWDNGWHWHKHGSPGAEIKVEPHVAPVKVATVPFGGAQRTFAFVVSKDGSVHSRIRGQDWSWGAVPMLPGAKAAEILGATAYVRNGRYIKVDVFVRGEDLHVYRLGAEFDTREDLGLDSAPVNAITHASGALWPGSVAYAAMDLATRAPAQGTTIRLATSDSVAVRVPGAVIVPAERSRAMIPMEIAPTVDSGTVVLTATGDVTLRATARVSGYSRAVLQLGSQAGFVAPVNGVASDGALTYATHFLAKKDYPHESVVRGELVVVDGTTLIEAGPRLTVGFQPRSVAINPNPSVNCIYVVNAGKESFNLTIIDRDRWEEIESSPIPLGMGLVDVAVSSHTNRVYVSNAYRGVHVIEMLAGSQTKEHRMVKTIAVGRGPMGLAVDNADHLVYVARTFRSGEPNVHAVTIIRDDDLTVQSELQHPLLFHPVDVALSTVDGHTLLLAAVFGARTPAVGPGVVVFNLSAPATPPAYIPLRSNPTALVARGGEAFVAIGGGVQAIDLRRRTVVGTIPTGPFPRSIAVSPIAESVYVGEGLAGTITQLSIPNFQETTKWS